MSYSVFMERFPTLDIFSTMDMPDWENVEHIVDIEVVGVRAVSMMTKLHHVVTLPLPDNWERAYVFD